MITTLPDDVLCLVLQHISFRGKCNMQLVCRKFRALLSTPPPGLWGELNLVTDIINRTHTANMGRQVPQRPNPLRMPQPCHIRGLSWSTRSALQMQVAHEEAPRLCKHQVRHSPGQTDRCQRTYDPYGKAERRLHQGHRTPYRLKLRCRPLTYRLAACALTILRVRICVHVCLTKNPRIA